MAFLLSVFIDSFFSQNDGGISPLVLFFKKNSLAICLWRFVLDQAEE